MNGLEQAQDEGAAVDAENLIASIAEKVQQRQLLRQQQTQQTQQNNKSNKVQVIYTEHNRLYNIYCIVGTSSY